METWYLIANRRKIKIMREYLGLLKKRGMTPKKASAIVCSHYCICQKTIYNYIKKFADIPLRGLQ